MKIEIIGEDIAVPSDLARRLFTDLGLPEPDEAQPSDGGPTRADPFTVAVGVSSIILMLPPGHRRDNQPDRPRPSRHRAQGRRRPQGRA